MTDETKPAKGADILPLRAPRRCANCSKETVRAFYPFCSKRCKDIDLHRWLSGAYAIPVVERDAGDDEES
jgi:endogenous inhibitor of DNA gyrase (YacG/DUF329 family)